MNLENVDLEAIYAQEDKAIDNFFWKNGNSSSNKKF